MALPKISVITPSYNQGRFIEQTILSVISQQYPNLEFMILDAASTDNTVEIIKKYENQITYYRSEKDNGQASAINEGLQRATGDILCWINSDDIYLPGIFYKIAAHLTDRDIPRVVFGNCIHFNSESGKVRNSFATQAHKKYRLSLCDYVVQPSSFWNRSAWNLTGKLNERLHYAFDWDWFVRAQKAGVHFLPVEEFLSLYRIHAEHKSATGGNRRVEELKTLVSLYNDDRLSKAFDKWMLMYGRNGFISKSMDVAQRFNLHFPNTLFRWLLFHSLSPNEYESVIAMK